MDTAAQLVLLAELANLDTKRKSINDRLDSVPATAKKVSAETETTKKQVESLQAKKAELEKQRRLVDGEIAAERVKLRKWEARMPALKGEREHAALGSEISGQKRAIARLEERGLEQLQSLEETDKELAKLEPRWKESSASADAEWAKVAGDLESMKAELAGLNQARAALLTKLPPGISKQYERVAEKRAGVGVAIIRGEVCSCCRRSLPPQLCLQVYKGVVIEACPSCNRLLVHEAMTRAPEDAAPTA